MGRTRSRARGFTLIELVIVMVLLGFLSAVGAKMIAGTMETSYIASRNHSSGSQARYAMERITREIREMAFGATGYSVPTMGASSIVFTKEDGTAVTITYSGTSITLGYAGGTTSILTNQLVSGATNTFQYRDQLGGTTADKEDVRFVEVTLAFANTTTGQTETLRNRVFLRNAQAAP
jgi:prepilin-type N-terminal cleavage/methylation domain-containing protein